MAIDKVNSEITGTVWKILAQVGEQVEVEQTIMIIESMKMEIPVVATVKGTLKEVLVAEGQEVSEGQDLAVIET